MLRVITIHSWQKGISIVYIVAFFSCYFVFVSLDNVLFATEMFGAVNAIDPKTGRNFEDLVPIFQEIDWLTTDERYKITEGNVRKLFPRIFDRSAG